MRRLAKRKQTIKAGSRKARRVTYRKPGSGARMGVAEPKASPVRANTPRARQPSRKKRYARLRRLLRQWMDDDPSYDERVSAALESLPPGPVRFREDFE